MASDVRLNQARKNADEMRMLQEKHQERRSRTVERNEQQIKDLRRRYNNQKSEIRQNGEAAVNHIKQNYENEKELIAKKGHDDVRNLKDRHSSRYAIEQKRGAERIRQAQERFDENEKKIFGKIKDRNETEKQNYAFHKKQIDQVKKQSDKKVRDLRQSTDQHIKDVQSKAQLREKQIKSDNSLKTNQLKTEQSYKIAELKKNHAFEVKNLRSRVENELKALENRHRDLEAKLTQDHNKTMEDNKNRSETEIKDLKGRYFLEKQKLSQDHNTAVLGLEISHKEKEDQLRELHDIELQRIHRLGDLEISEEKERITEDKKRLKSQNQAFLAKQKVDFEVNMKQDRAIYENQVARNHEVYKGNLKQQKEGFQKRVEINKAVHQDVLNNQSQIFTKALIQKQNEFVKKLDKYANKEDDPFYKIAAPQVEMVEDGVGYTVKLEIPEHELENFDIRIQEDKIVVSGKREFKDRIESENNKQSLQSSSYQTVRQEFQLEVPAISNAAKKRYENGVLTVWAPKVGHSAV